MDESSELKKEIEDVLFPYEKLRSAQRAMVQETLRAITDKRNLIVHAPTGLGKTAAAIAPAVKYAIDNNKKLFFLTSRHTQHLIAIETLKQIRSKYDLDFTAVDIIGKKWMCTVPGTDSMYGGEFYEYCEKQRADNACEFYNKTKKGTFLTTEGKIMLETLRKKGACHKREFTELCSQEGLCAYEMAASLAKEATVIVADYYYIYNNNIRNSFFKRAEISPDDCIIIVDEGHNLPDRIRNLMTSQLTSILLKRAIKEAKEMDNQILVEKIVQLQDILNELSKELKLGEEKDIKKDEFMERVSRIGEYDELIEDLDFAAGITHKNLKRSWIAPVASFLEQWNGSDTGFARIISFKRGKREDVTSLSYRCLDPALVSKEVIESCHSTIIMSGTLTPTEMYRDILGFPEDTVQRNYKSPFPEENRLALLVPETTTKFSQRTDEQYERIAQICADVTNRIPGNSAIFFPSYHIRDNVYRFFEPLSKKTAFVEVTDMSNEEKTEFLEKFKSYRLTGSVLLGAVSGSYGEGVDLPGDLLKCVIVVGLPLQQPTLETKNLIKYYDNKFGKGWDYGYVGPAFSKCLQSAGRCIRTENDRGVILFLDERYAWGNYYKHFPQNMHLRVTNDYAVEIEEFFQKRI